MKTILAQIVIASADFLISREISDTHFSGSVAGILVMALNRLTSEALSE